MSVVVLNSGGFDSVCLMHKVREIEGMDCEIHSLYFQYGEQNYTMQVDCARRVSDKIGAKFREIDLPKFDWTSGSFYGPNTHKSKDECYLEWRNLVFLSYAISYAESLGCSKIYVAFLKGTYEDTDEDFLRNINNLIGDKIDIIAPFKDVVDKRELLPIATKYKIEAGDYFSCDVPVKGKPCGECIDCKSLKHVNSALTIDHPFKAFLNGEYGDKFISLMLDQKITELRALINNDCQFKCKHCFYGFEDTVGECLQPREYYELVIRPAILNLNVENIHFSGKEPLYSPNKLFEILGYMKEDRLLDKCTFNLVTNGGNLTKKVAERLKDFGVERVFISVDNGILRFKNPGIKALEVCRDLNIPVTIFYDLFDGNSVEGMGDILPYIVENFDNVKEVYVRNVRNIGNAEINKSELKEKDILHAINWLNTISDVYSNVYYSLNLSMELLGFFNKGVLNKILTLLDDLRTVQLKSNLEVSVERYCGRYGDTITVTPDGYVLGCASEVASPYYDKVSIGNVIDEDLSRLVRRAKRDIAGVCNKCYFEEEKERKCSFLYEIY